jgi:hypothetical protein
MTYYDYKVVPAPKRAKRVKGVRGTDELFALTLTDAINEVARQGWEYVRAEHLPAEGPGGWFRGPTAGEQTVLVFRRAREALGPRLAAVRSDVRSDVREDVGARPGEAPEAPPEPAVAPEERAVIDRLHQSLRREPTLWQDHGGDEEPGPPTPLRPAPRLGPAKP